MVSHSAAKAPFLAKFSVQKCGINELESVGLHGSAEITEIPRRKKKNVITNEACIFKVGDDVRQVTLLLNIHELEDRFASTYPRLLLQMSVAKDVVVL